MDKKNVFTALLLALIALVVVSITKDCGKAVERVVTDTVVIEKTDTVYIERTDTMPVTKYVTKIKEVMIPIEVKGDSVKLDVVQKTFSDDSTYTAYVTGIGLDDMPKLDSITVRQREITRMVERTITVTVKERKRWNFGIQVGAGLGITTLKPDIYVGVGGMYSF